MGPVKMMKYNHACDTVVSADLRGMIEYWSPATLQFPEDEYVVLTFLEQFPCSSSYLQMKDGCRV